MCSVRALPVGSGDPNSQQLSIKDIKQDVCINLSLRNHMPLLRNNFSSVMVPRFRKPPRIFNHINLQ